MKFKQMMVGAAAATLALSACSTELSREDAIEDLVEGGVTEETANCVLDDLEASGIEAKELEDSVITPETEAQVSVAFENCLTGGDIAGLLSPEEVRESFVGGLTGSGDIDETQGNCIYDFLVDQGVTTDQLAENTFSQDLVAEAVGACI